MRTILASLSEVPEALQGEYEEKGGKFFLKLEGDVPGFVPAQDLGDMRQKVDRFRDSYTALMKRTKDIAGVDEMDEDLTPLRTMVASLKGKLASSGPESLQEQIQIAIKPLQEKLDRSEAERATAQQRASKALLRENIGSVLTKGGAQPNALGFLLDRSEIVFEVKDDKVAAREGQINELGKPVTPSDWLVTATKEYDFAFKKSSGGGAPGSNGEPVAADGATILRNPTPEQLGSWDGKMKIVND